MVFMVVGHKLMCGAVWDVVWETLRDLLIAAELLHAASLNVTRFMHWCIDALMQIYQASCAEVCLARTASAHCKVWHLSSFKPLAVMKLTNIVIVLALACVPVQSDDFAKNLRGESAVGVPEKEQDVTAQKESTDEEVGAVLAELDTSAEATEGVDEQERAARVCKRWVTCTNGFFGGIRCSGGRHCTLWQRWAFWPVLNSLDAQQSSASFVAGGREIYRNLLLWPANFTATTGQGHLLSLNEPCLHQLRCWLNSSGRTLWGL